MELAPKAADQLPAKEQDKSRDRGQASKGTAFADPCKSTSRFTTPFMKTVNLYSVKEITL